MSYRTRQAQSGGRNSYYNNPPSRFQTKPPQQQQQQQLQQQPPQEQHSQLPPQPTVQSNLVKTTAVSKQYNIQQSASSLINSVQPPPPPPPMDEDSIKTEATSAVAKALAGLEAHESIKKRFVNKGKRLPYAVRKRKMSSRLAQYMTPRSAVMLINELKPGSIFRVLEPQQSSGPLSVSFVVNVEYENKVLGTGQGMSRALAKSKAAENALKNIVAETMETVRHAQHTPLPQLLQQQQQQQQQQPPRQQEDDPMDNGDNEGGEGTPGQDDPIRSLPWVDLASFAIYKLFNEWQCEDIPFPRRVKSKKAKEGEKKVRELPPNALEMHPVMVLTLMKPGIQTVEISRTPPPTPSITLGYEVDSCMYTGVGSNKKIAKKEAAKAALKSVYGLIYPDTA